MHCPIGDCWDWQRLYFLLRYCKVPTPMFCMNLVERVGVPLARLRRFMFPNALNRSA